MQTSINELNEPQPEVQGLGAWLLPISDTVTVAVGRHELKYIEYVSECLTLPGLPAYCEKGFMWRNRFIPAIDMQNLITRRRLPSTGSDQLAAIVAYENNQGEIELGAILVRGVPKLISVLPSQSADTSRLTREWRPIIHAAFSIPLEHAETSTFVNQQEIYPVLNLQCLFEKTPADLLSMH